MYGTVAGVLFGLTSSLAMPTLVYLHESVRTMLSHWECYALAVVGLLAFVIQQVSLGRAGWRQLSPRSRLPTLWSRS